MRSTILIVLIASLGLAAAAGFRGALDRTAPNGHVMLVRSPEQWDLEGALNTCNTFASDQDLKNIGLEPKLRHMCESTFNHKVDEVHFNPDGNPNKMCLKAGKTEWTGLSPSSGTRVVASDSYTNTLDQSVDHSFSLTGNFGQTATVSTTNTVTLSATVGYSVDILEVVKASFSLSTSFSSSKTETSTDSNSAGYTSKTDIKVAPGDGIQVDLVVDTKTYDSRFATPMCVDGYFRCQFPDAVSDPSNPGAGKHFFWYLTVGGIPESQRCVTQKGKMGASIAINSKTVTKKL